MHYVLDTNAYALIFQSPRTDAYEKLKAVITQEREMRFFLPEIVAMEIHSVVGKFRRGGVAGGHETCARNIVVEGVVGKCAHTCHIAKRPRMSAKVFKGLQKLMSDIESQRGDIQATILPLTTQAMEEGRRLLVRHSHQLAFGSHDALVAATVQTSSTDQIKMTLVTSDRSLKAVCNEHSIPVFDPNR